MYNLSKNQFQLMTILVRYIKHGSNSKGRWTIKMLLLTINNPYNKYINAEKRINGESL